MSYLYDINGKSLLSGQHNYNQSMNVFSDSVKAVTGKYPAVWGTDFIWNGTKDKQAGRKWRNQAVENDV